MDFSDHLFVYSEIYVLLITTFWFNRIVHTRAKLFIHFHSVMRKKSIAQY